MQAALADYMHSTKSRPVVAEYATTQLRYNTLYVPMYVLRLNNMHVATSLSACSSTVLFVLFVLFVCISYLASSTS